MSKENPSLEIEFLRPSEDATPRGLEAFTVEEVQSPAFPNVRRVQTMQRIEDQVAAGVAPREVLLSEGPVDDAALEVIIGEANFLPAWFLQVGAQTAAAVCKLEASGVNHQGARGAWSGTGFLVTPSILLTNHHVLNSVEVARDATAIFNYQYDRDGMLDATKGFRLDPDRLFITSPARGGLDFTVVWVKDEPGREYGHIALDRNAFTIRDFEYVNVVQHPAGRPKSVVLQDNRVRKQDESLVHYTSDTEPGSSGSCVFNNLWTPVALHHASRPAPPDEVQAGYQYLNEGIKFTAIATYLEQVAQKGQADSRAAQEALEAIGGSDAMLGFFGSLGRTTAAPAANPLETVVTSYQGELQDVDVAFWNIEWFNRRPEKLPDVAQVIKNMNLDIWALEEVSPTATKALVDYLREKYDMDFGMAASEPDASDAVQSTTVIWNRCTVNGEAAQWPEDVRKWFGVHSTQFDTLGLEAVEGKIFPRQPGLFHFNAITPPDAAPFDFYLVPLHLKAMDEGSKRRRMAAGASWVRLSKR